MSQAKGPEVSLGLGPRKRTWVEGMTYTGTSRTRGSRGTLFTRRALKDKRKGNSGLVWDKRCQKPVLSPYSGHAVPRRPLVDTPPTIPLHALLTLSEVPWKCP